MNIKKITAAVLMSAAVLSLAGCGKGTTDSGSSNNGGGLLSKSKTLDVSNYAVVEVEGYDTAGKSTCTIDFDGIVNDNLELFGINALDTGKISEIKKDLKLCLDAAADKTEELSNGETIHVTWDIKNADAFKEKHDVVLEGNGKDVTVEELKATTTLDPFDFIVVRNIFSRIETSVLTATNENGKDLYAQYEDPNLDHYLACISPLRLDENGEISAETLYLPDNIPEDGYPFTLVMTDYTTNFLREKYGIIFSKTEQTYIAKGDTIERKN